MRLAAIVVIGVLAAACGGDDVGLPPTTAGDPDLMVLLPSASDLGVDYSEVPLAGPSGSSDPMCNGFAAISSPVRRAGRAFARTGEAVVVLVMVIQAEHGAGPDVFDQLTSVFEPGTKCESEPSADLLTTDIRVVPPIADGQEGRAIRAQGDRGTEAEGASMLTRVFLIDDLILSVSAFGGNNQVSARIDGAVAVAAEAISDRA